MRLSHLILSALILSQPAVAQKPASEADPDDIVVTGTRDQLKAIKNYVNGLTSVVSSNTLARYPENSYCPAVLGLSAERNRQIAERMRTVAAAAGVKPAAPGCAPSALVMFVENKERFLEEFRKTHPVYFSNPNGDSWTPSKGEERAVAWQLVQQLDPDGVPLQRTSKFGPTTVSSTMRGSRILSMAETAVAMSVVIVDREALRGLTPTQIADYALMRTLTDPSADAAKGSKQFTILQAIDAPMGSAVPQSLTEWDLAYLKGRYSGDPARYGQSQRAAIQRSVERAAAKSGKGEVERP